MIYITDTSRTITIPKTRELSGDLNLRVTNILTGVTTVFAVVNSSTNPYIYKVVLSLAQVTRLDYGEYVYELLVGEAVAGQGLLRKPKVYNADTAYTNIEPNVVYGGNGTVTRYRVVISASVGCSIVVNGQTYQTYDRNVPEGTILAVSANPQQGYEFVTWSDGVEEQTRTIIVESDVNLYASVEAETYQVTITAGDHGSVSVNGTVGDFSEILPFNTEIQVVANPDTGYQFYQWSDGDTNATRTIRVTGPVSLTSAYATETYQVTITAGEHCSITVNGQPGDFSQILPFNTELQLVATPEEGYNFSWSDGNQSTNRTILVDSDITLTTETQIQSFVVNIMSSNPDEGAVVINGTVGDLNTHCNYGTVLHLSTNPSTGFDFLMWSDGVIADQRTITVTDNVTLRATFAAQVMNVSITSPTGNGSFTINGQTYTSYITTVPYGTVLNVEAVPDSHYHFTQWSDGSTSTTKTLNVTSNVTLTGLFAINQYQVTLSAGANGTISVDGVSYNNRFFQQINYGTTLNISGVADNGYDFDQWSDGDNTNPRTITVTGPVSLTASFQEHFAQNTRQIVYTTLNGTTTTPSGDAYDADNNPLTVESNDYSRGFGVITYSGDIYKLGDRMYDSNTDLQTVTVPDGVNEIGEYCFNGCSNMTNVYFGDNSNLKHIWGYGFANTALESIVLPDGFIDWSNWIFDGVTTLSHITIPRLSQDMGWYSSDAFAGFNTYNGVIETTIYNSDYYYCNEYCVNTLVNDYNWTVKYIEKFVLVDAHGMCNEYNTSSLVAYDADNNPLTVSKAYFGCGKTLFTFSGDVAYIDGLANPNISSNSDVKKVTINLPTLTEIGDAMFTGCPNLKQITITTTTAPVVHSNTFKNVAPNGTLTYPGYPDSTAYNSWLSTSDYYLGYYNWNNVMGFENVIFIKSSNSNLAIDAQYLFDEDDNQVSLQSHSYDGIWHRFVLDRLFAKISDGTASAGWIDPAYRSSVQDIKFNNVPNITSIGDYQWSGFSNIYYGDDNIGLFTGVRTLGDYGFSGSELSYNKGFNSLTTIGVGAFKNAKLRDTTINGTFTRIEDEAFLFDNSGSWATAGLNIKSSSFITYIGHNVFGGFTDSSNNPWKLAIIPTSNVLVETDAIKSGISNRGYVKIPKTFTALDTLLAATDANVSYFDEIVYTTTDNNPISAYCCEYTNVYDSVNNIGHGLYDGNGEYVYRDNSNLASVVIYGRASNSIFIECSNLASADFSNCTYIGNEAFDETILKDIHIPATLTEIRERPFRCDYNTLVVDPDNPYWKDENSNALITKANDVPNTSWYYANTLVTIGKNDQIPSGVVNCAGWTFSGTNRTKAVNVPLSVQGFADCCWNENCSINGVVYDGNPSTWSGEIMKDVGLRHYVYMQYKSDCEQRWPDETWYVRSVEDNTIYYTANTTAQVTPTTTTGWGANYVESVFDSGTKEGEIRFDGPITAIPDSAFLNDTNLAYIEIPSSTLTVGDHAFEGCSNLGEICTKAQTEPTVGASTFKNIKTGGKLTKPTGSSREYSHIYVDINYTNNWLNYDTYKLGSYEWNDLRPNINYDNSLQLYYIQYGIDNQSTYPDTRINTAKFYKKGTTAATYNRASNESTSICRANFDDNFLAIGIDAFSTALRVTNVTVRRNVYIVNAAFRSNTSITNATLYCPIVAQQTFLDCTSLTRVDLYNTVYLGSQVFGGCTSLNKIRFWTATPPKVEATTFANVPQTGTIIVPTGSDYSSILYRLPSGWTIQYA